MDTIQLILWGIGLMFFAGLSGFGFGMSRMAKRKDKEISELVIKIAENEQDRRTQADAIRLISLDHSNMKHRIRKLLKQYNQMSKTPFGKKLREVIDE